MVRLDRIYTRGGDTGDTSLVGGTRVPKTHVRVEAYGTVDEMNAAVGLARVHATALSSTNPDAQRVAAELERIQNLLFDLGSELATEPASFYEGQPRIAEEHVKALEALIDELNADLPPLESFVLPGGGEISGFLHLARTICRRAERRILALSRSAEVGEWALPFVNRLSDTFFVLSRWVGKRLGEPEYLWRK